MHISEKKKKMNLPEQGFRGTCILTNIFKISGVSLFLMQSAVTLTLLSKRAKDSMKQIKGQ